MELELSRSRADGMTADNPFSSVADANDARWVVPALVNAEQACASEIIAVAILARPTAERHGPRASRPLPRKGFFLWSPDPARASADRVKRGACRQESRTSRRVIGKRRVVVHVASAARFIGETRTGP